MQAGLCSCQWPFHVLPPLIALTVCKLAGAPLVPVTTGLARVGCLPAATSSQLSGTTGPTVGRRRPEATWFPLYVLLIIHHGHGHIMGALWGKYTSCPLTSPGTRLYPRLLFLPAPPRWSLMYYSEPRPCAPSH